MSISENIAVFTQRYKDEHHLSIVELAQALGIGKNTAVGCLKGAGNLRCDTIGVIAEKCGVSAAEIISAHPLGWEQAEIVERAARLFSGLAPEQRERALNLFLALVDVLSEGDQS